MFMADRESPVWGQAVPTLGSLTNSGWIGAAMTCRIGSVVFFSVCTGWFYHAPFRPFCRPSLLGFTFSLLGAAFRLLDAPGILLGAAFRLLGCNYPAWKPHQAKSSKKRTGMFCRFC